MNNALVIKLTPIKSKKAWENAAGDTLVYLPKYGDDAYTKNQFIDLCGGNSFLGYRLFKECEWQHPETVLDEEGGLEKFKKNYLE